MFTNRRTLAAALAWLCLAWLPASAQQGPGKVLLIIRDYDDAARLMLALGHAGQLKRAGAEVRVLFQDEAVLAALRLPLEVQAGDLETDSPADLFEERDYPSHDYKLGRVGDRPVGNRLALTRKLKYSGKLDYPYVIVNTVWAELKALKIPYEISALSAKVHGVFDELKAKGEPLTPDADKTPDISGYVRDGYRVAVF